MVYHVLALLDCSPSHGAHHLNQTEFPQFSTTSPAACLCSNYLLLVTVLIYLVVVFPPTFAEEIFVYCLLAGLENKVRHLWWPNLLNRIWVSLWLPTLHQTSAAPLRGLGRAKYIISCEMPWNKIYFHFLKKHFFIIKSGWMVHFSLPLTGVFVLFCPLSFYYPIIRMTSLAFFFLSTLYLTDTTRDKKNIQLIAFSCVLIYWI